LEAQQFFHDVTYDYRLRDNSAEIYQFHGSFDNNYVAENGYASTVSPYNVDDNNSNSRNNSDNSSSTATINTKPVYTTPNKLLNCVFTWFTNCYSPTCAQGVSCYSTSYSRRIKEQSRFSKELNSRLGSNDSQLRRHGRKQPTLWIETAPREISDVISKEEKWQEVIHEIIYTEQSFIDDLETFEVFTWKHFVMQTLSVIL
jgi:hypothetical protein